VEGAQAVGNGSGGGASAGGGGGGEGGGVGAEGEAEEGRFPARPETEEEVAAARGEG